jgi:hypothetical protein
MKKIIAFSMAFMLFTMTSCKLAGDIFSAGFYTGLFIVALVIAIIVFIAIKLRGRR